MCKSKSSHSSIVISKLTSSTYLDAPLHELLALRSCSSSVEKAFRSLPQSYVRDRVITTIT